MKIFLITLLSSMILLSGCADKTGHRFLEKMSDQEIAATLVKGETTKAKVKQLYGDPEDIDKKENGAEMWKYEFILSGPKASNFIPGVGSIYRGYNERIKILEILFSEEDVVDKFAFSNTKGEIKGWIFQ